MYFCITKRTKGVFSHFGIFLRRFLVMTAPAPLRANHVAAYPACVSGPTLNSTACSLSGLCRGFSLEEEEEEEENRGGTRSPDPSKGGSDRPVP